MLQTAAASRFSTILALFMSHITRRSLFAAAGLPMIACKARPAGIRIEEIRFDYEDYHYRAPMKFGGVAVDRATVLNVHSTVSTAAGKRAHGFGSMPLSNPWAFPSRTMPYERTLEAMKNLASRIAPITGTCGLRGHPIDLNVELEPEYLKAAAQVSEQMRLDRPIPKLATLVTASAFDAAIHDAFGKLHNRSCYRTYGPEFMPYDLSRYLGPDFKGEYLDRYIAAAPKPRMPFYHLVGAADPIFESDIKQRLNDGLPETLAEWIVYNGLTHIKIKLNGDDLAWDLERVVNVERSAAETQRKRSVSNWVYSLDFNERCPNVEYLLSFLRRLKEQTPEGYERIQYIEQPTSRDLKADRQNVMHAAARMKPIVIDESLTDLENLLLSREMGYTGAALKACKQQSQAVLMAAAGIKYKMFLCVQDLACPGASLVHSAGLAAHVPGVAAIESNSGQYLPAANKGWEDRFPGIFKVRDGYMYTGGLQGPGLSAVS